MLKILQVVRRFGPVGGMEHYAWELAAALAARGHEVKVLCEGCSMPSPHPGIVVETLGSIWPWKPSWLAALRYSIRVRRWLARHGELGWIIHSHVRCGNHHVVTFHGPPFARIREAPFWKKISLRVFMQLHLERRDLMADTVRAVVPNSPLIAAMLRHLYPEAGARITVPIPPGVSPDIRWQERPIVPRGGGVVGFLGFEWKRKGLEKAIVIMGELAKLRPEVIFMVAGPQPEEVATLFQGVGFRYELAGIVSTPEFILKVDLLLHPAAMEPYGMVVAEALASGARVVVSDQCGIAPEIQHPDGAVLPLDAADDIWAHKVDSLLGIMAPTSGYCRTWERVAEEYEGVYGEIAACLIGREG